MLVIFRWWCFLGPAGVAPATARRPRLLADTVSRIVAGVLTLVPAARRALPACVWVLGSCALFRGDATLSSSVVLGPNERARLQVRAVPLAPLTLRMEGLGPGAVAFTRRGPDGAALAMGLLVHDRAGVACSSSDGELTVEFLADGQGGSVAYTASSAHGFSILFAPGEPKAGTTAAPASASGPWTPGAARP